jgi:hypothetical protein
MSQMSVELISYYNPSQKKLLTQPEIAIQLLLAFNLSFI